MLTRKNYDNLDITKLIASICVVALHANALYDVSLWANSVVCLGLFRLAVPLFFVISAFFLFIKPISWENTKKYCKRLLKLYISWFIVSIPKTIFDRFILVDGSIKKKIFLFIRSFFVTSTFSGSWFIVSCIFCALVFTYLESLNERKRNVLTILFSSFVYLWVTFTSGYGKLISFFGMDNFYQVYKMVFADPCCSFLVGIPYFAIGRLFAKNKAVEIEIDIKHITKTMVCLFLLLFEIVFVRINNLQNSSDCYLMLLPCVYFMFPILLNWKVEYKYTKEIRIASTIIFFSQFIFLYVCEFIEWFLIITIPCFYKFVFTVFSGFLLTWILLKLKNSEKFDWVKYFY